MSDTPDIQPTYVSRFYEMDPEVDDLLPDGTYLRDGMHVLLEDSWMRGDADRAGCNVFEDERLREANRWCEVSHLTIQPRPDAMPLVSFVAIYPDGTKKKRRYDASYAWLVRLFSLGAAPKGQA